MMKIPNFQKLMYKTFIGYPNLKISLLPMCDLHLIAFEYCPRDNYLISILMQIPVLGITCGGRNTQVMCMIYRLRNFPTCTVCLCVCLFPARNKKVAFNLNLQQASI